ncbi:MAG: cupin domain-containing protein [Dehalococcoidia bacterium]|nr:cupin domain-containing protein [Dehalococcoidia bacterium]
MGERKHLVDYGGYKPGRCIIKRGEIRLEPSDHKGVYIGNVITPEMGFFNATTSVYIHHIAPGTRTEMHRHDDTLLHVLSGTGYSVIGGDEYEWEPGDTIHIKPGVWHQHWNTSDIPANMIAAKGTPLLNHFKPLKMVVRGDRSYTDIGDYVPDHAFGLGRLEIPIAPGETWIGPAQKAWRDQIAAWEKRMEEARVILRGKDVRWEKSGVQGGEFNAPVADWGLGFDSRLIHMGMQRQIPGGCNETHIHMEAIVYILRGKGRVMVDDQWHDVEEGDCIFVHSGQWHQFCNPAAPGGEAFIQLRILTMNLTDLYLFPFPYLEKDDSSPGSDFDTEYAPQLPW